MRTFRPPTRVLRQPTWNQYFRLRSQGWVLMRADRLKSGMRILMMIHYQMIEGVIRIQPNNGPFDDGRVHIFFGEDGFIADERDLMFVWAKENDEQRSVRTRWVFDRLVERMGTSGVGR